MTNTKKPILITGSHRSGTTWAGNMLCAAPKAAYVHEPFNINPMLFNPCDFEHWFEYICVQNEAKYLEKLRNLIAFKYPLLSSLKKASSARDIAKIFRNYGQFLYFNANNYTPVLKDPIALFSASWLAETFDMNVLVMIRHPAAFCSSLKLKDWQFDFTYFLNQPLLMEEYLTPFDDEIKAHVAEKKDIISQAILLWNCIHHTIGIYQEKHPSWTFLKHEDLSLDPVSEFKKVYQSFDLEFTEKVNAAIEASSGTHNPTEQQSNNEFVRNSKANITNWKSRLTEAEIELIKEKTGDVSKKFYNESEW